MTRNSILPEQPQWYKDAIIYELHVRAFRDSNNDGIGDFGGLFEKLDYLADLGITAIWLLPFYTSPLRDGGYDIADYFNIHPDYGNRRDFKRFLVEAHQRGIRVLTELVINHTSVEHEWFQRARQAPPGSTDRNFYVWSNDPKGYPDARIIFQDFERSNWAWDSVANAYYWHRFFSHQPDLNFDNPEVVRSIFRVLDFWMELGVDAVRLDAIPYLFEREGTTCENLPETHAFLKSLRRHVDERFKNRMLLAEANQWPVDAAAYFGDGDECHMNFHFPLMPRLFMAIQNEDAFPIVDILRQTPSIPNSCQWATFLRNHDELTLEMVTEEDRDYMYRVYAKDERAKVNLGIRRRLFPLLRERRTVELMNGLLFALPGTPVVYYGDEIGMGDNIYLGDRDGVRTPMQWNSDRNAGFSSANPQKLYLPVVVDPEFHYEAVNVEAQQTNPSSLLWWMKRIIALRKQYQALSRGDIHFVEHPNPRMLAFIRRLGSEIILFVANLSRFAQHTALELIEYRGMTPTEMFGRSPFPVIEEVPYSVMLGPHDQLWLSLTWHQPMELSTAAPAIEVADSWFQIFQQPQRRELARRLGQFASNQRWYRSKGRHVKETSIDDVFQFESPAGAVVLVMLGVELSDAPRELYAVPLCYLPGDAARTFSERFPNAFVSWLKIAKDGDSADSGALFDGMATTSFAEIALQLTRQGRAVPGEIGKLEIQVLNRTLAKVPTEELRPSLGTFEQSNSTVVYGRKLLTKFVRRLEEGPNIEVELGAMLQRAPVRCAVTQFHAVTNYRLRGEVFTLAVTSEYVANRGTAWDLAIESIDVFFERVLTSETPLEPIPGPELPVATLSGPLEVPIEHLAVPFFSYVRALGASTAQMHLALASDTKNSSFAPEPFTIQHQQSLYQSARSLFKRVLGQLRHQLTILNEDMRMHMKSILLQAEMVEERLQRITTKKFDTQRIRCHGDYHLGQVLFTGDDFVIIDFEGEPARPIAERRFKRCPLRDVAGMTRSFDYAVATSLRSGRFRQEDSAKLATFAASLRDWSAAAFVHAYVEAMGDSALLPKASETIAELLAFYELEKCLYEVGYELANRPEWLEIPVYSLARMLGIELLSGISSDMPPPASP